MNESTSGEAIGTTMRGIGPCYRDKVGRSYAIRLGDMYRDNFAGRIEQIAAAKRRILRGLGCPDESIQLDPQEIYRQYSQYAERLRPYVADTTAYLLDAVEAGKKMLFEGAQGALLGHRSRHFPVRHQQQQFGRRRVGRFGRARPLHHQGDRHRQGVLHAGRRRPVSDRAGQRHRPAHPRARQRIWHGHAASAALRLVRRGGGTLHGASERRGQSGGHAAGRAERVAGVEDLHGLRTWTAGESRISPTTWTTCGGSCRFTRRCPAGNRKSARPGRWAICRRGRAQYLARLSELVGRPVEVVSVGPDRQQTIFARDVHST